MTCKSTRKECKEVLLPVVIYFEDCAKKQRRTDQPTTRLDDELSRPRVPHEILFAVGGWSFGSPTNFIETYDTR
jgi:kelch-like protein 10